MGDNSLSIVLYADELGAFTKRTMEVWFKVALTHNDGAEFILVTFNPEDVSASDFQNEHELDGVRIVSMFVLMEGNTGRLKSVMKESHYWVDANYVLVAPAASYPSSEMFEKVDFGLDRVNLFNRVYIKEPFNYSTRIQAPHWDVTSEGYPDLEEEPFILPSTVFRGIGLAMAGSNPIDGKSIAQGISVLTGIDFVRNSKAEFFMLQK